MDLSILEKIKVHTTRFQCEYAGVKWNVRASSLEHAIEKIEKWVANHDKKQAKWKEDSVALVEDADAVEEIHGKMAWNDTLVKIDRREDNKISVHNPNRHVRPERALFRLLAYGDVEPAALGLRAEQLYRKVRKQRDRRAEEVSEVTAVVDAVSVRMGGEFRQGRTVDSWRIPLGERKSGNYTSKVTLTVKVHKEELLMEGSAWNSNIESWSGAKAMMTLERMGQDPQIAAVLADPTLMKKHNEKYGEDHNEQMRKMRGKPK
jgi:hypothetical protein